MKKYLLSFAMVVMGSTLVTSCISDDDSDKGGSSSKISVTSGLYVINNGTGARTMAVLPISTMSRYRLSSYSVVPVALAIRPMTLLPKATRSLSSVLRRTPSS